MVVTRLFIAVGWIRICWGEDTVLLFQVSLVEGDMLSEILRALSVGARMHLGTLVETYNGCWNLIGFIFHRFTRMNVYSIDIVET